jgi:hypothetical protein
MVGHRLPFLSTEPNVPVITLSIEAGVGGAELEDVVEEGIDVGAAMTSVSTGNETVAALSESVVENATYQLSPQCRSSELQDHFAQGKDFQVH